MGGPPIEWLNKWGTNGVFPKHNYTKLKFGHNSHQTSHIGILLRYNCAQGKPINMLSLGKPHKTTERKGMY